MVPNTLWRVNTAIVQWRRISQETKRQCPELLEPFLEEASSITLPQDAEQSGWVVRDKSLITLEFGVQSVIQHPRAGSYL